MRRRAATTFGAAAAALFTILLLSLRHVEGVPTFVVILLVALIALSGWHPGAALMVLAASVPIAAWTGRWWSGTVAWPETLVVAFAAGYCARSLWSGRERRDDLDLPIFVFTALVIASLTVRLLVLYWTLGGAVLWEQLLQLLRGKYFISSGGFRELDAAMRLIEGMVLLRAAATAAQENPLFAPRLTRWFVVGAAAAAALNLWRVWQGALRVEEPVAAFFRYLMTLRYNVHYADVNAAGSYFVMALLVAIGLVVATRRAYWLGTALLIATSLMLSGSRAALLAGAMAVIAWSAWRSTRVLQKHHSRSLVVASVSMLLVGCIAAGIYYVSVRRNVTPVSAALEIRAEFARTTLRMIAEYPAFGVGIGQYVNRSGDYSSPRLKETFRMPRENAHNNFFQILGELGIVGSIAFLWVLASAAARYIPAPAIVRDRRQEGTAAGLLAFVLTWLTGHPLLLDEPSASFWVLLGGSVSSTSDGKSAVRAGSVTVPVVAIGVGATLALSAPFQAKAHFATVDLEHRGIGLSTWQAELDGVPYRFAGVRSTLFVPGDVRRLSFVLRSVPGRELEVALDLDGRRADVVRVSGHRWREVQLLLPDLQEAPRFCRVDLFVAGEYLETEPLLMVGKVAAR